jgi:hypothetical protein
MTRGIDPAKADIHDIDYLQRKARVCRIEANRVSNALAAKLIALAALYEAQAERARQTL